MKRIVFLLILFTALGGFAQERPDLEEGLKPYKSYHGGDIDSVSLANGNVSIQIPLLAYPQRGGKLQMSFTAYYNSKGWDIENYTIQGTEYRRYRWLGDGIRVQRDQTYGYSQNAILLYDYSIPPEERRPTRIVMNYAVGPDGAQHQTTPWSLDTSGIRGATNFTDRTGVTYTGANTCKDSTYHHCHSFNTNNLTVSDRNGNQITSVLDANGKVSGWQDTTNRFISNAYYNVPDIGAPCPADYPWNVPGPNGTTVTFTLHMECVSISSAFATPSVDDATVSWSFLKKIILPDGTYWAFDYTGNGDLQKITFPTGGYIQYTWDVLNACNNGQGYSRRVSSRTVFDGTNARTWTYSMSANSTTVTDPEGNQTVHDFLPEAPPDYQCTGHAYQVRTYQGSQANGTLLKTVVTDYQRVVNPYYVYTHVSDTYVPIRTTTIWPDGKQVKSEQTPDSGQPYTFYDYSIDVNNPTTSTQYALLGQTLRSDEFDYGSGAPGGKLTTKLTTYKSQTDSTYLDAGLIDLPSSQTLQNGAGVDCSKSETFYDDSARLVSSSISTQHVAVTGPRGNLSNTRRYLSETPCQSGATWRAIDSYVNTLDTGAVASTIDPLGHSTAFTYDPAYAGALLTRTENDATHFVTATYDSNTGLMKTFTDQNAQVSSFDYDSMFRLTSGSFPDGGQTTFTFPSVTTVHKTQKLDSARNLQYEVNFDGVGRDIQSKLFDPQGDVLTETTYDTRGRVWKVTNPHRANSAATDGVTETKYDALGRVTDVIKQDGSHVRSDYQNGGTATVVTDESGRQRRSFTDGLGRLIQVDEPGNAFVPATNGGSTLTVAGSLQSSTLTTSATSGTGSVTISGTEQTTWDEITIYDIGNVSVIVNGVTKSVTYNRYSTDVSVASALRTAIAGDTSYPVTAGGTGTTITLTARTTGAATNYLLSTTASGNSAYFSYPSFTGTPSGSTLTGGANGSSTTTWDAGTVTVTVNGHATVTNYNQSTSTATQVANAIASAINSDPAASVSAVASGANVTVTSKIAGASSNYGWTVAAATSLPGTFAQPSFSSSPASGTMAGGADAGSGLSAPWTTLYTYDTLGNLTCVEQHGTATSGTGCSADPSNDATSPWRVRRFTYDSLARLRTAQNPESGLITYNYDDDGNVTSEVSPAPNQTGSATLTITHAYDALHRLTGKTYSNGDPAVSYFYDQSSYNGLSIANGNGRRTGMSDASGQTAWTYDVMGRASKERRTIASITKELTYSYNLDGSAATLKYPSNAIVTFTYDTAGHLLAAVDSGNNINYATSAAYTPTGALSSLTLGNSSSFAGYTLANTYNNRLQPTLLSANRPTGTILSRFYTYGANQQNNGNISAITDNLTADRSVTYTYDQLNRIATAQSTGTSCATVSGNAAITQNWGNSYTIDAWGNLTAKTVTKCSSESLSTTVSVKNQLGIGTHDAAGNLMSNGGASYTYDAENRIASTAGVTYIYDGDGVRVKKSGGSSSPTLYWGESFTAGPIAETDLSGTLKAEYVYFGGKRIARRDYPCTVPDKCVHYYFSDHLNSTNLVYSASGTLEEDSDFYPYGGERGYTLGSGNHFKFTGKERDPESGLDYFGARYYGNSLGRFLTPDWAAKPVGVPYAQFGDPQTLNLYAYVANRPVMLVDLDGHDACDKKCKDKKKKKKGGQSANFDDYFDDLWKKIKSAREGAQSYERKASEALDNFNENIGFGSSDCATGPEGSCINATGMAATFIFVQFASDGMAAEAGQAKQGIWVYRIVENGETVYIGITNNLRQRAIQHGVPSLERIVQLGTRLEARAVEQALLEGYRAEGLVLRNKINSISTRNPVYKAAIKFGNAVLKSLDYKFKDPI